MNKRGVIEGLVSELTGAHGLRRGLYRGCAKVDLQNLFTATACNVKRWLQSLTELKIGYNTQLLPFTNVLYSLRRFFLGTPVSRNSFCIHSPQAVLIVKP